MAVLVKSPERIQRVCADIARHFQEKVVPNGFGAQVVAFDRESCVLYKKELDELPAAEFSDIVMTVISGDRPSTRPSGGTRTPKRSFLTASGTLRIR